MKGGRDWKYRLNRLGSQCGLVFDVVGDVVVDSFVERKLFVMLFVVIFGLAFLALDDLLSDHAIAIIRVGTGSTSPGSLKSKVSNEAQMAVDNLSSLPRPERRERRI
jgi:hypothetical protein